MALFVDGPACTIGDLTDQDSGLLNVALTTGINVSTKLRLAVEEIRTDLHLWLIRPRPASYQGVALLLAPVQEPILHIGQIVVTPPLKRWETMHALALVYRDAYFSQLVDRYQAKWQEYANLTRGATESFIASGLGLVRNPVVQAAPPILSMTPGPQGGGTFYASVAWVNAANQEGAPSYASSLTVSDGNLMTVGVTGAPSNAVGFNVYAGTSLTAMLRQNDLLLPVGAAFTYVPGEITQGPLPGNGQMPDFTRPLARTMLRG
jgi:hypothetical protein